ncbi:MAG: helix-turn-helix domain-containing protein [Alphaproteobacteria bacterium]|nr:helix-turn-helix domain-containing protein [Alphaproteobacteria bacterium]
MAKRTAPDPRRSIPAPAGYIRFLLRRFGPSPALRAELLQGTDIDEVRLADPAAEVTLFTFITFNDNLCRLVGEAWPLDAMAAFSTSMQGALEVAVRSAPTIGEGLDVLARFGQVRGPFLSVRLKREAKAMRLIYRPGVAISEPGWRALSATGAFGMAAMLGALMEGDTEGFSFYFNWPTPKYVDRMREALPGTLKFAAPECAIVVPHDVCQRASPFADAALHATALAELEQTSRRIHGEDTLVLQIERLLKRRRAGRLTEDDAAEELGLSRRTLVRRLSESGTTFRTLLDANLKERARQMLEDRKLSRDEMAKSLGFEDPTSFSRACRRWFRAD